MARYQFTPKGVCSRQMIIDVEDGIIRNLEVIGGCSGNLSGISRLVKGRSCKEVAETLRGTRCGMKPTSCPDQLAIALEAILEQQ
ncbi:MAG: TIGR03905 family TSCPD domain-containing protein [Holdemanella sp.]|nr:TIGR03905 family TSCPD domain-containing protein [Holdemanella sp.]